jgi:serine/threonine-protein kinase
MKFGLFVRPLDAGARDIAIKEAKAGLITSPDWSMDNKHIVYTDDDDLWTVAMTGDRKPSVFLKTTYRERQPAFSPDSRWVAYSSDSSGREEVYIRPFPHGETVHPVSRSGGFAPRWRHDGKELFFVNGDSMMAVSTDPATGTTVGVPRELFRAEFRPENNRPFDVTRDGQRFLVPTIRPSDDFRVVLNWRTLLPR